MTGAVKVRGLREIAAWQIPELLMVAEEKQRLNDFRPGIPSLQRGAVWKPRQIEFLWDSLMRGFPVGSFVVCKRIEGQVSHLGSQGPLAAAIDESDFTHHLLDGQQRANAIALGFVDPASGDIERKYPAYLWLDLAPEAIKSPRRFVFRVTTKAHPWGFDDDEACSRLGVENIRLSVSGLSDSDRKEQWPFKASLPIPFAWLLELEDVSSLDITALVARLKAKLDTLPKGQVLHSRLQKVLEGETSKIEAHWRVIRRGLERIRITQLFALEVPNEALFDEVGEESDQISNVEALFTRLNSAGTPLEGAELTYSMIKAYWPEIEAKIDPLPKPVPSAQMASLAFRVALSDSSKLVPVPNISAMRRLATAKEPESEVGKRNCIRSYLGLDGQKSPSFSEDLDTVNALLLWKHVGDGDIGLPPFVRNELARSSPETLLLLLYLAPAIRKLGAPVPLESRKLLVGLATALHWFGGDTEKHRIEAANGVLQTLSGKPLELESFRGVLSKARNEETKTGMMHLIAPGSFDRILPPIELDRLDGLENWKAWDAIVERDKYWPCFHKLRGLKGLLLYSQREYLGKTWNEFDPSDVMAWEDHNRPWDYDHILPAATLYYKQRKYKWAGDEWMNSIGNLRAWPLEKNRSKSDTPLDKIDAVESKDSLLTSEHCDLEGFLKTSADFDAPEPAAAFMNAARSRMFRMYRDWFETLQIGVLLGSADSSNPEGSEVGE